MYSFFTHLNVFSRFTKNHNINSDRQKGIGEFEIVYHFVVVEVRSMDDFNIHSNRNDEIQHAVHGQDTAAKKGGAKSWLTILGVLAVVAVIAIWVLG